MPELEVALLVSALTLAFLAVVIRGRRGGGRRRELRRALGAGAVSAGAALLLVSLLELP